MTEQNLLDWQPEKDRLTVAEIGRFRATVYRSSVGQGYQAAVKFWGVLHYSAPWPTLEGAQTACEAALRDYRRELEAEARLHGLLSGEERDANHTAR